MSWSGTWFGPEAGSGGSSVGTGTIITILPAPGQISSDPAVARWTPIVATIELRDSDNLFAFYVAHGTRFMIYDPDNGFAPLYADKSSLTATDPNPDTAAARNIVTLLPNGGWQNIEFQVILVTGQEMSIA